VLLVYIHLRTEEKEEEGRPGFLPNVLFREGEGREEVTVANVPSSTTCFVI